MSSGQSRYEKSFEDFQTDLRRALASYMLASGLLADARRYGYEYLMQQRSVQVLRALDALWAAQEARHNAEIDLEREAKRELAQRRASNVRASNHYYSTRGIACS